MSIIKNFKNNLQFLPSTTLELPKDLFTQKITLKDINQFIGHLTILIPYCCRHPRMIIKKIDELKENGLLEANKELKELMGNEIIWHGAIGEVIATASILSLTDYKIPFFKLRLVPNRSKPMLGDDLLGFQFMEDGSPKALLVLEAKNYLTGVKSALKKANETLLSVKNGIPVLFDFIINALHLQNRIEEASCIIRFLNQYNYEYYKEYSSFIVTDLNRWHDEYIEEILDNYASPLKITSFLIPDWEQHQKKIIISDNEKRANIRFPNISINDLEEINNLLENNKFKNDQEQLASAALAINLQIEKRNRTKYTLDEIKIESAIRFVTFTAFQFFNSSPDIAKNYFKEAANIYEKLSLWNFEKGNRDNYIRNTINSAVFYSISGYSANSRVLIERIKQENIQDIKFSTLFYNLIKYFFLGKIPLLMDTLGEFFFEFPKKNKSNNISEEEWLDLISFKIAEIGDFFIATIFSKLIKFLKSGNKIDLEDLEKLFNLSAIQYELIGDYNSYNLLMCFEKVIKNFIKNSSQNIIRDIITEKRINNNWQRYLRVLSTTGNFPMLTLWESQKIILKKGLFNNSSLLISMPTSSGKSRIVEIAIFDFLNNNPEKICIYIVPTRALASEVEESLGKNLSKMGIRISVLYGGYDSSYFEEEIIKDNQVFVLTPEKLDLLLRNNGDFKDKISLIIIDEFQETATASPRSLNIELIYSRLFYIAEKNKSKIICLSTVIKNTDDFINWIFGNKDNLLETDWRPTKLRYGLFEWYKYINASIRYFPIKDDFPKEDFFVPLYFKKSDINDRNEIGVASRLGQYYAKTGPTLIFTSSKKNVENIIDDVIDSNQIYYNNDTTDYKYLIKSCENILGQEHKLVKALKVGACYHHADLPRTIRKILENAVRLNLINLIISTTTLSQGVNLPIKNVIVHSLEYPKISMTQFWNAIGRAGRAGYETEGNIVFCKIKDLLRVKNETDTEKSESFITSGIKILLSQQLPSVFSNLDFLEKWALVSTSQFRQEGASYNNWGIRKKKNADAKKELILSTLDSQLLSWLIEAAFEEISDEDINLIFKKLLCNIQMVDYKSLLEEFKLSVKNKIISIKNSVPDFSKQKLFNATGLSRKSNEIIHDYANSIKDYIDNAVFFSIPEDFWAKTIYVFSRIIEFSKTLKENDKDLILNWIECKNYKDLARIYNNSIEKTVERLEELIFYIPWGLNSLNQHLIYFLEEDNLPDILKELPALVNYGVPNIIAVFIMNLGINDREIATIISKKYINNNLDFNFKAVKEWLFNLSQEELKEIMLAEQQIDLLRIEDCLENLYLKKNSLLNIRQVLDFQIVGEENIDKIEKENLIIIKKDNDFWLTTFEYKQMWKLAGENISKIKKIDRQYNEFLIKETNNKNKIIKIEIL